MYRKRIIERMKEVEREYAVARHAIVRLSAHMRMGEMLPDELKLTAADAQRCAEQLEATYYIRLFAVFEGALREIWRVAMDKRTHPKVRDLLNGCAARRRVPSDDLEGIHGVREYRNALVHGGEAEPIPLDRALARLSTFFSRMPPSW